MESRYARNRQSQVRGAIEEAMAHDGPVIIDFIVEEEERVYPMIKAGAPLRTLSRSLTSHRRRWHDDHERYSYRAAAHHTALVRDKPGVLNRVSSMFRRRGFNIVSLAVGHSEEPDLSRMTFVVEGDKRTIEQVNKHLHKLHRRNSRRQRCRATTWCPASLPSLRSERAARPARRLSRSSRYSTPRSRVSPPTT